LDSATSRSSASAARPSRTLALAALAQRRRLGANHQRERRVGADHVEDRTPFAVDEAPHDLHVLASVAATQTLGRVVQPQHAWRVESLDGDALRRDDVQRRRRTKRQLVESVVGVHEDGVANSAGLEHLGHVPEELVLGHADEGPLDEGRIRERSEDVEDGSKAQGPADRCQVAERVMEGRGEQESDPGAFDAGADYLRRRVEAHAERVEDVGRTHRRRRGPIAVLGDPHPASSHHERRHGGDVDRMQLVAAGADYVDSVGADREGVGRRDHGVDESGHLVGGLSLGRERR
jgi:hypothetical protein